MSIGRNDIWVFAETSEGKPTPVFYELLAKALEMKESIDSSQVCAVLLGNNNSAAIDTVKVSGCDTVISLEHEKLEKYDVMTFSTAFEDLISQYDPMMLLMGATAIGAELAPTVAAKVKTGLAAHCIDIQVDGDRINCMVPAFGGRVISEIYIPDTRPAMASVRPGILTANSATECGTAEVIQATAGCLNDFVSPVELVSFTKDAPASGVKLEDAQIVVCAGRGVSTKEAWEHLKELAGRLGGAVGYTRSFVDLGFVQDESAMIGTSGKSVKPKLFLGFGISGASHHTCGMNKSELVITVNKNDQAKMFNASDYGVVGDADRLITALLKRL